MTWNELPIRRIFRVVNGGTPTPDESNWNGSIPWATPVDLGRVNGGNITFTERSLSMDGVRAGSRIVPSGSILISTRAPIGYVARNAYDMAFNQGCRALVPVAEVDTKFFAYQLSAMSHRLQRAGQGTTFLELSTDALSALKVVVPPIEEQQRITGLLDAEMGRIERLLEARNRQILMLDEREVSLIAYHLGGFDAPAGRISTSWPWMASIPKSWTIGPVYAYYEVLLGKMLNAERASGPSPKPYLRNANVHWYKIDTEDLATMSFEPSEYVRYRLKRGDLLVCEGGAGVAEAAVWDGHVEECFYQKSLHRVRSRSDLPVEWLMYWLRLAKNMGVFASEGNVATIPHLTGEQLREYRIPIPLDGWRRVGVLAQEIRNIAEIRSKLCRANELLLERRQALVARETTGWPT